MEFSEAASLLWAEFAHGRALQFITRKQEAERTQLRRRLSVELGRIATDDDVAARERAERDQFLIDECKAFILRAHVALAPFAPSLEEERAADLQTERQPQMYAVR
jgi:hypothetical protein